MSNSSLAGSAILSFSTDSIFNSVEKVVSKSDAVNVNLLLLISNKKFSKIGRVVTLFIIPPIIWSPLRREALDTINFIMKYNF